MPLRLLIDSNIKGIQVYKSEIKECFIDEIENDMEQHYKGKIKIINQNIEKYLEFKKLELYGVAQNSQNDLFIPKQYIQFNFNNITGDEYSIEASLVDFSNDNQALKSWKVNSLVTSCETLTQESNYFTKNIASYFLGELNKENLHTTLKKVIYPKNFKEGVDLYNKRNLQDSILFFNKVMDSDPNFYLTYSYMAKIYYLLGWQKQKSRESDANAREYFEKSLKFSKLSESNVDLSLENLKTQFIKYSIPDMFDPQLRFEFAKKAYNLNPDDAETIYFYWLSKGAESNDPLIERAIQMNPFDPYILNDYGLILLKKKKMEDALKLLSRSINSDKTYIDPYINIVNLYLLQKNADKALKVVKDINNNFPNNPLGFYYNGLILYERKNYSDSIVKFEKAIELSSLFPEAYYYIGKNYDKLGDPIKRNEYLQISCQQNYRKACLEK